jgi:hypothetical protein
LVFASAAAAATSIEALDIEVELRAAFDEAGVPHRVEWLRANVRSGFAVQNGEYRLVPSGSPDPLALLALIAAHPAARDAAGEPVDLTDLVGSLRAAS